MQHLGNITKIHGGEVPFVDCVIGGSPCQDLSLAGKQRGLAGERSGLYMDQIRIIKEMRQEYARRNPNEPVERIKPRYMLWENVPGAFSSNGGRDFSAVLEEAIRIAEPQAPNVPAPVNGWQKSGGVRDVLGRWSVAWRVLDAQYWGVPQRRARIALVADFGGSTAHEILFERDSVSGNTEQSGEARQAAARGARNGAESANVYSVDMGGGKSSANYYEGIAPTLTCTHGGEPAIASSQFVQVERERESLTGTVGSYMTFTRNTANTLMARDYKDPPIVLLLGSAVARERRAAALHTVGSLHRH